MDMLKKWYISSALFIVSSCACFFNCHITWVNPTDALKVSGIVYTSKATYASHIIIRLFRVDAVALPDSTIKIDAVYTDSLGRYTLNGLKDGSYNAFGERDGELFFRHNILVEGGEAGTDILLDTLKPAGSLLLFVKYRYHKTDSSVIGILPGTGRYLLENNSEGIFQATNFPSGTYAIRFQSNRYNYVPIDTTITIRAGITDTLADTLYLRNNDIGRVSGLTASYDSSSRRVMLSWDKTSAQSFSGFNIYKAEFDHEFKLLASRPYTDTVYADNQLTLWKTYHYRVAIAGTGVEGPLSEPASVQVLYKPRGWYRGQLHCHTTNSDGALPVDMVIKKYRTESYDFVAVSDHNQVSPTQQFSDSTFVTIPNDELTFGAKHVNAVNAAKPFLDTLPIPYRLQDIVNAALSIGAFAQINHPIYSEHSVSDIVNSTGAFLLEVINLRHDNPLQSIALWDSVLSCGRYIYGTAGDDAHDYSFGYNRAWIMVNAPKLTVAAITASLSEGNFYASTGPVISGIIKDRRKFRVESFDGVTVEFIGKNGRIVATADSCCAQYILPESEPYVRAQVTNVEGKVAYTQAYVP
jgi:hypothetical protein